MVDALLALACSVAEQVEDPEIPVLTVADLGILRDVAVRDGVVEVSITPTFLGCPATLVIATDIETALYHAGFASVRVISRLSPAWSTDDITETGRRKLLEAGIAPPGTIACPRCGSVDTETISSFGSTLCKALHRCLTCREPFEAFKCSHHAT